MNVLVIDDNEFIRTSLEKYLTSNGYIVQTVANGEEAMARLGAHGNPISIVITDVVMPGMDGFDVVDEINNHRVIGRKLGLIAMSGGGRTIDAKTALEAMGGLVDVYLRKPFKPEELQDALKTVIDKYELEFTESEDEETFWEIE